MSYVSLSALGPSNQLTTLDNPLLSCSVNGLESMLLTGNTYNTVDTSKNAQLFSAGYCSNNWDGVCEYMSKNTQTTFPAMLSGNYAQNELTDPVMMAQGDILVRQTAMNKYTKFMSSNCERVYQPFNPTVTNSPFVSEWKPKESSNNPVCTAIYDVDAKVIDSDPVMNKILQKPMIAMNVLLNIYNYRKGSGRLNELKGTKLYNLFMSNWFQQSLKVSSTLPSYAN